MVGIPRNNADERGAVFGNCALGFGVWPQIAAGLAKADQHDQAEG
jgi:hypothetical protein